MGRRESYALATALAQAVNPQVTVGDMPIAAALVQPAATRALEILAEDGWRLVRSGPESPETRTRPVLRVLPSSGECHNNDRCGGCDPAAA